MEDKTQEEKETAHIELEHIQILEHYPPHAPREGDSHYHIFHETRERLRREGKLKECFINNKDCSKQYPIELHHKYVEYALINDVDWQKFVSLHPEFTITSEEEFFCWCETEENLLPLCKYHHTGIGGIHHLPDPLWMIQRYLKEGTDPPAVIILQSKGQTINNANS